MQHLTVYSLHDEVLEFTAVLAIGWYNTIIEAAFVLQKAAAIHRLLLVIYGACSFKALLGRARMDLARHQVSLHPNL